MTASRTAYRRPVLASSQYAESLTTLRLRMADLERGRRIKELRKAKAERTGRKVTQPQMAEAVGVTLRAAQEWEYGGGIDDEHLPLLLDFLETDADYLLRGGTPNLLESLNGGQPDMAQKVIDELKPELRRLGRKIDRALADLKESRKVPGPKGALSPTERKPSPQGQAQPSSDPAESKPGPE